MGHIPPIGNNPNIHTTQDPATPSYAKAYSAWNDLWENHMSGGSSSPQLNLGTTPEDIAKNLDLVISDLNTVISYENSIAGSQGPAENFVTQASYALDSLLKLQQQIGTLTPGSTGYNNAVTAAQVNAGGYLSSINGALP